MAFGLLKPRPGTHYFDADALVVATTVAQLAAFGLEPRHIRAFKSAADREVGLIEQVVSPLARSQGDNAARTRSRHRGRARRAVGPPARRPGQDRPAPTLTPRPAALGLTARRVG